MICGIHVGENGALREYMVYYTSVLEKNGIPYVLLDSSDPSFWDKVRGVDLFIYRWAQYDTDRQIAEAVIPVVEKELHVTCYPDTATSWSFDDKIRQQYLYSSAGFPVSSLKLAYHIFQSNASIPRKKQPLPD